MKVNEIDKIKELLKALPDKDIPKGEKFLNNRNWESLKELINSAIVRINRSIVKDLPEIDLRYVNVDKLWQLKETVDYYVDTILHEDIEENYSIDYE